MPATPVARARAALRGPLALPTLALGIALGAASLIVYSASGYGRGMLFLWLAGLLALAVSFWNLSGALPRVAARDLIAPVALAVAFAPLYLAAIYRWPVQVSSDEQAIMIVSRDYAHADGVDPFGLSTYFSRPSLLFVLWGRAAELLGGIDLFEMRLLHAFFGLLLIGASYALFRQLLSRPWAIFASFLLGSSHALFIISRLAMRENTAVLAEVVGFALLLWGLRHDHPFSTFCGGLVAGLGFYVYYPGRATIALWLLFLVGLALAFRKSAPLLKLLKLGSVAAAGFALMAGPVMVAESKIPAGTVSAQHETLMIYAEARKVQQGWVFAPSEWEGFKTNVEYGLGSLAPWPFNNEVVDHGWIYVNNDHGFIDPLTGILLWIGIGTVGWRLIRRRGEPWSLLVLGSFLVLWLSFAFLVNKAPNYTRLLITLPLIAYLVTEAVRAIGERARSRYGSPRALVGIAVAAGAAIAVWNLAIAWDYIQEGRNHGDDIGSTGRYVESHRDDPGQTFYISSDDANWRYFVWGDPRERVRVFARETPVGATIDPNRLGSFKANPPFVVFMRRDLWTQAGRPLADRYPQARLQNITPDGRLVVLEVPKRL